MTLRVSDWHSESDLDSVRNSWDVFTNTNWPFKVSWSRWLCLFCYSRRNTKWLGKLCFDSVFIVVVLSLMGGKGLIIQPRITRKGRKQLNKINKKTFIETAHWRGKIHGSKYHHFPGNVIIATSFVPFSIQKTHPLLSGLILKPRPSSRFT